LRRGNRYPYRGAVRLPRWWRKCRPFVGLAVKEKPALLLSLRRPSRARLGDRRRAQVGTQEQTSDAHQDITRLFLCTCDLPLDIYIDRWPHQADREVLQVKPIRSKPITVKDDIGETYILKHQRARVLLVGKEMLYSCT
jgi:hypothetical protein